MTILVAYLTVMIFSAFISSSRSSDIWNSYTHPRSLYSSFHLHLFWVYYEPITDRLPVGLLAKLVRALHQYGRGQGLNPSWPNFFEAFLFAATQVAYLTVMIFATLILRAAVQKYEIHVFIVSYTCWYYVTLQLRCWSSLKLIELGKGNVFGDLEVRKNDGGG